MTRRCLLPDVLTLLFPLVIVLPPTTTARCRHFAWRFRYRASTEHVTFAVHCTRCSTTQLFYFPVPYIVRTYTLRRIYYTPPLPTLHTPPDVVPLRLGDTLF